MPILETIGGAIFSKMAGVAIGSALDRVENAWVAYQNREISKEQYEAQKVEAIEDARATVETAWAEASAKVYESAQETIRQSFTAKSWFTRNAWAFIVFTQTFVLLWYQLLLPWYIYFAEVPLTGNEAFPRTGDDLLQWAYLIIVACLGIGVYQMRKEGRL